MITRGAFGQGGSKLTKPDNKPRKTQLYLDPETRQHNGPKPLEGGQTGQYVCIVIWGRCQLLVLHHPVQVMHPLSELLAFTGHVRDDAADLPQDVGPAEARTQDKADAHQALKDILRSNVLECRARALCLQLSDVPYGLVLYGPK